MPNKTYILHHYSNEICKLGKKEEIEFLLHFSQKFHLTSKGVPNTRKVFLTGTKDITI